MGAFKKALLLFILLLTYSIYSMSQDTEKNYDSLWKKVEELSNKKGLTKSALAEVDKIYLRAKKEKKEGQLIKALLYRLNLKETFEEEDDRTSGISELEKQINNSTGPSASILNSILAEKYLSYFNKIAGNYMTAQQL